jgi:predicted dehydrogenase
MEIIKAAVIGTGFIGSAHIEALRRIGGVDVVSITSGDNDGAKALAEKYSIAKVFSTWEEIIDDKEVQVIHNCTPNYLHYEINKAAILAGKHIISEKPLTITSDQSAELLRLVKEKKVVHAVNFNYRFYPLIQHAKKMIEDNEIGITYLVHGHYLQDWLYFDTDYNWRLESEQSGSSRAVADIGSHWCDLIQFLTGKKITKVFANLVTIHKTRKRPVGAIETFKNKMAGVSDDNRKNFAVDTEDAGSVMLQFENGVQGVFTVSQVSAGRKNCLWIEIDGSKKAISWNQEEPNQLWIGFREKGNEVLIKDPSLLSDKAKQYAHYPGGHPEGYADTPMNLFANVYDFIRKGKDPLIDKPEFPTFEDGDWENRIVEAVLKSNQTQSWVDVK